MAMKFNLYGKRVFLPWNIKYPITEGKWKGPIKKQKETGKSPIKPPPKGNPMKELKDLLKENKYLEAKAFILDNLDKVEECIDDVLKELVDREPLRALCINQKAKKVLVERMKKEGCERYHHILKSVEGPDVEKLDDNWIEQDVNKSLLTHRSSEPPKYEPRYDDLPYEPPTGVGYFPQRHLKMMFSDETKKEATVKIGGIPVVGIDNIPKDSINFSSKSKGAVSGLANMGDEYDIVDPKGVDLSYLKSMGNKLDIPDKD